MAARPSPHPLLVGREREITILRERLDTALAGHGGVVLIGGEAGIGKTALAEALCHEAAAQGALVLVGRCYDLSETPPYGPWADLFGQYQQPDGSIPGNMPPLPATFSGRGAVGEIASQTALYRQMQAFFAALSALQPTVLLLDDLHWSDPASLDLLRVVARTLATMPMLIVVTYRSDELTRHHPLSALLPLLTREAKAVRLALTPLDNAAIRVLLVGRYDLSDPDIARLASYLHARGEGNALFVGELLRSLEETAALRRDGDTWTLADLSQIPVPMLLRQVIDGRLNRLDEESQRLLAIAAIIGQEVPYALWSMVAAADEESLLAVVERAEGARVMEETADGTGTRFTHALIREALYEGARPSRRRTWHRQIGDALVAGQSPDPDAVSYHFRAAGDARATVWLVAAGERALRAYAWVTATERYRAALALMEGQLSEPHERALTFYRLGVIQAFVAPSQGVEYLEKSQRLAQEGGDAALAAASLYHLGNLRCIAGSVRRGLAEMETAAVALSTLPPEGMKRLPSLTMYGLSLTGHNSPVVPVLWLAYVGRYTEALAVGEPLLAKAREDASVLSDASRGSASLGLGVAYAARGQPDASRQAFTDAFAAYEAAGHYAQCVSASQREIWWHVLPYHADDPAECERVTARSEYALARAYEVVGKRSTGEMRVPLMMLRGQWDEARRLASATSGAPRRLMIRLCRGPLAYAQGDATAAWEIVYEELPDGPNTAPGDGVFIEMQGIQRLAALLAIEAGDLTTARAWLAAHDRWLASNDSVLGLAEGQLMWARYHRADGKSERADRHARLALAHASEPRQPLTLLAAHRLLGELDTAAGRFGDAATHFDASLVLADACIAPYERALTLLAMAELAAARGTPDAAQSLLDEVRAICTPLGAKPALARADALTAGLDAMRDAPRRYPAGLSAREVEVLRLLAAGRTNREIAEALFLSEHTVHAHVNHIYTKTATDNRVAATGFALRHGLV